MIVGHTLSWSIYGENYHISNIPAERLTHLIYGYANISEQGLVIHGDVFADIKNSYPGDDPTSTTARGNFRQMQLLKEKYPDLQIILSVGGWAWSKYFSDVSLTKESRERFTESLIDYIQTYHFDGVEIDWEYPVAGGSKPGTIKRPEDKENFVLLLFEVKKQLKQLEIERKKKYWFFATFSTEPHLYQGVDLKKVAEAVDYVSLLSYNYYGFWEMKTAHRAPLHPFPVDGNEPSSSVSTYMEPMLAAIPPEKLLFTISPLATSWAGVSAENNGLNQTAKTIPSGAYDEGDFHSGTYGYSHILKMIENPAYQLHWDDRSKVNYLYSSTEMGGHFVSFESERSLEYKLDFIQQKGLGGVIFRDMYGDGLGERSMLSAIHKRFLPVAFYRIETLKSLLKYWYLSFSIPPLFLIAVTLLVTKIRKNRFILVEEQEDIEDKQEFEQLSKSLHGIDTPLSGLISFADDFEYHREKLEKSGGMEELIQLGEKSRQLGMVIHMILNNTTLARTIGSPEIQSLDPVYTLRQVAGISSVKQRQKSIDYNWQIATPIPTLYADEVQLQRVLRYGMNHVLDSAKHSGNIVLNLMEEKEEVSISITDPDPAIPITVQHFPELERMQRLTKQQGGIFYVVPSEQSQQLRFSFPKSNQQPGNTVGKLVVHQKESSEKTEEQNRNTALTSAQRITALQDFTKQLEQFKDVDHLLEILFDFFLNDEQSERVTLIQEGKVIKESHPEDEVKESESMEKAYATMDEDKELQLVGDEKKMLLATPQGISEYTFVIECSEPLNQEDLDYFNSLLSQASMVRKHLYGLVRKPQLLSELYEIASRRNTLLFIKAEKGYSGIYERGKRKPQIICSRLRKLKLYFDDQNLLQVHRSYLVNPTKVTEVRKVSKSKYEIEIDRNKIPVSRVYLDRLRKQKPEWFHAQSA